MSATLAPTIWDLARGRFNTIAKRRRVPEDPKWNAPKGVAVISAAASVLCTLINLTTFLKQPDVVSTLSVAFSAKAAVDATVNCVKTFRAARQSALHIADPLEPEPTLTPAESEARSQLAEAFALASLVPNWLNNGYFVCAAASAAAAFRLYRGSKRPRGPGE